MVIRRLVILDYIRHYGEDGISGVNFVGAVTKLGSDEATSVVAPEFLSFVPGFFATGVEESVRSLESLLRMCFTQKPSDEDLYLMLGYNLSVPPYAVRRCSRAPSTMMIFCPESANPY